MLDSFSTTLKLIILWLQSKTTPGTASFSCFFLWVFLLTSSFRKQFFFSPLVFLPNWLVNFGLCLFGIFSPPHLAEVSVQFSEGSWNLTLLLSVLNLQISVQLHSFCSLLLNLLGSNLVIYLIIFHPQGLYCAFVSLLYKAIRLLYNLSCTLPNPHLNILFRHS